MCIAERGNIVTGIFTKFADVQIESVMSSWAMLTWIKTQVGEEEHGKYGISSSGCKDLQGRKDWKNLGLKDNILY